MNGWTGIEWMEWDKMDVIEWMEWDRMDETG
jgi:hypothetical protein